MAVGAIAAIVGLLLQGTAMAGQASKSKKDAGLAALGNNPDDPTSSGRYTPTANQFVAQSPTTQPGIVGGRPPTTGQRLRDIGAPVTASPYPASAPLTTMSAASSPVQANQARADASPYPASAPMTTSPQRVNSAADKSRTGQSTTSSVLGDAQMGMQMGLQIGQLMQMMQAPAPQVRNLLPPAGSTFTPSAQNFQAMLRQQQQQQQQFQNPFMRQRLGSLYG